MANDQPVTPGERGHRWFVKREWHGLASAIFHEAWYLVMGVSFVMHGGWWVVLGVALLALTAAQQIATDRA